MGGGWEGGGECRVVGTYLDGPSQSVCLVVANLLLIRLHTGLLPVPELVVVYIPVCARVSMCVCMCVYGHECMHPSVYMCAYVCVHACMCECVHVYLCTCGHIHMHGCVNACVQYVYVCLPMCVKPIVLPCFLEFMLLSQ